jgi:hypothetical protein
MSLGYQTLDWMETDNCSWEIFFALNAKAQRRTTDIFEFARCTSVNTRAGSCSSEGPACFRRSIALLFGRDVGHLVERHEIIKFS